MTAEAYGRHYLRIILCISKWRYNALHPMSDFPFPAGGLGLESSNRGPSMRGHRPPGGHDYDDDDHDADGDVQVHLPLALLLLAAETQTRNIVGHVGPQRAKPRSRNKCFVMERPTERGQS